MLNVGEIKSKKRSEGKISEEYGSNRRRGRDRMNVGGDEGEREGDI